MKQLHDINFEAGLLSSIMVGDAIGKELILEVNEDFFYHRQNKELFLVIYDLYESGKEIDFITIMNKAKDHQKQYFNKVSDVVMSSANGKYYLGEVRDLYLKRYIREQLLNLSNNITKTSLVDLKIQLSNLSRIEDQSNPNQTLLINKVIEENIEQKYAEESKGFKKIYSGFGKVDKKMDFKRGEITTIGGRTGQGKTSLVLSMIWQMVKNNYSCFYFTNETKKRQAVEKLLSFENRLSDSDLQNLSTAEYVEASQKLYEKVVDNDVFFKLRDRAFEIREIVSEIRINNDKHKLDVVVIDLVNKIRYDSKLPKTYEIEQIYIELGKVAVECDIHIIVIAQINRGVSNNVTHKNNDESEENIHKEPRPKLKDLKSSGAIEESSANVWLLYRPFFRYPEHEDNSKAIVDMAKGRYTGEALFYFYFNKVTTQFTELSFEER